MIHGVFGKLGSGKGLHVMEIIKDELIKGFRDIVTSVPLRAVPWVNGQGIPQIGLRAYLVSLGLEADWVDIALLRIKVVEDVDQMGDMFLIRRDGETGEWFKLESNHKDEKGKPDRFDPAEIQKRKCAPCLVITDEAWICYPNNGGWSRSPLIHFYARQQRKLRDEWYIVTQHPTDVDSVIWNIAQDFTVCRNHGMERMGIFRQPSMFRTITYLTNPAKGNAIRSHESCKRLDVKGLAQCYDTTAGVGFAGGFAGDANQRRSGLHFGWLVVGLGLLVVGLALVPHLIGKGAGAWIRSTTTPPKSATAWAGLKNGAASPPAGAVSSQVAPAQPVVENAGIQLSPSSVLVHDEPEIVCTGICLAGGEMSVFLSDGRCASSEFGEVGKVTTTSVRAFGQTFARVHVPIVHDVAEIAPAVAAMPALRPVATLPVAPVALVEPVQRSERPAMILPSIHGISPGRGEPLHGLASMRQNLNGF